MRSKAMLFVESGESISGWKRCLAKVGDSEHRLGRKDKQKLAQMSGKLVCLESVKQS